MSEIENIKREIPKLAGRAMFQPDTYNAENNTIEVVFATETPVLRSFWGESFFEVLVCDNASVRMQRMNQGAPVLDTHSTWSLDDQFGVVEKAWIVDKMCRAVVRLSAAEGDKDKVEKVKSGIIRNVSVGYIIYQYEMNDVPENETPTMRATDWEPHELSFVPVPADMNSGSRSKEGNNEVIIKRTNKNTMSKLNNGADAGTETRTDGVTPPATPAVTAAPAAQDINEEQIRTAALKEERTRAKEIFTASRAVKLPDEFAQTLVDAGTNLDQARKLIIDEIAKGETATLAVQSGIRTGVDEKEKKQRGLESAIMQRAGTVKPEAAGDPGEFRGMTLMDVAKECLTTAGVSFRGLTQYEIAGRALQLSGARDGGGGLSTGDFSYILTNVLNKTLRAMYDLQQKTFTTWTRKSTATDFKQMLRTQLNDVKLTQVQEGGEYTMASLGDSGEVYKVAKWGRIVNIDWEAIVNDDLSAFSRVPSFLAAAVAQMQGDIIYGILTGSHKMYDTNELFDATNHTNYTATGTAISVASLGVGRKLMRDQKSPGGNILNIAPKYLLTGSANEALALQYTSANFQPTKSADINVWAGLLTPIIESRITGTPWFLSADPAQIDTIEYATLEGQDIYTESRYGFDVDALQYKVRTVFGAKAIDWRSLYKNTGA